MKKITVLVFSIFILIACRKESSVNNEIPLENLSGVSVVDGRIIFPNEESYNNYFHSEDEQKLLSSKIFDSDFEGFVRDEQLDALSSGMRAGVSKCEIPNELVEDNQRFFNLLNKDGVFQIGEYIIRYSYCDDGAWVIKSNNYTKEEYKNQFLAGTLVDGIIGFFPSDVDGFEALEMGYITMPKEGTPDYKALKGEFDKPLMKVQSLTLFGDQGYEFFYIDNQSDNTARLRCKLAYDKFVFYFNFYGKEKYQLNKAAGWVTQPLLAGDRSEWIVDYQYRCRRKGKSSDYTGSGTVYPGHKGVTENKAEVIFYDGSRGLRNGDATFAVYNVHSKKRQIFRGGSDNGGGTLIVNETFSTYIYTDNYSNLPGAAGDAPMGIKF